MYRVRRIRQQWLLIPILIMLTFSGSFMVLNHKNPMISYPRTTFRSTEGPVRHVTKSLSELGKMDEVNKFVLLVNQIPNCGAEVLIFLLQKMQGSNNYRHVRLKGTNDEILERFQQEQFVEEIFNVMRKEAVPLSLDRQMLFINFTFFNKQSPTYINLIREPADKAISRSVYRSKQRDKDDLVQCLINKGNCTNLEVNPGYLTVPYFCGHDPRCLSGSDWALQTAKRNVERFYPVVGILEEMNATLEVLEHQVPYYFKGVQDIYKKSLMGKFFYRKKRDDQKLKSQLREVLAKEYDFYNWVKSRLFRQLQILYGDHGSH